MTGQKATQGSHQLLVGVEVRDQDDVRMRSVGGRNWTPNATEMAQASGQDWVEQDSGLAILPGAGAVPHHQSARRGTPAWPSMWS